MITFSALRLNMPSIAIDNSTASVWSHRCAVVVLHDVVGYLALHARRPDQMPLYARDVLGVLVRQRVLVLHDARVSTNRTWLAYPSSYSSSTSTEVVADTHSGYRAKSQITAAIRSGGALMTIDWVELSGMCAGYRVPPDRSGRTPGTLRGVREFSVPPAVTVGEAANLTDPVWDNAEVAPHIAVRPAQRAGLAGVSCAEFRDEVVAMARG
jgi:hypothetical protein